MSKPSLLRLPALLGPALAASPLAASLLAVSFIAPAPATAQAPTPAAQAPAAQQHVTVPSLPGERNREGTVKPSGELKTDAYGNLTQPIGPATTAVPAGSSRPPSKKSASPAGTAAPIPVGTAGPAPSSPAVATGQNTARIRGVVKTWEPGKSLTMTVRGTGKDVVYTPKAGAAVPEGLKAGDPIRIRVLTAEKGNVFDRVELLPKP